MVEAGSSRLLGTALWGVGLFSTRLGRASSSVFLSAAYMRTAAAPVMRGVLTAGLRYSVTIAPASKGSGKAAGRESTFRLVEDEDGWESIAEAQNAAATRALFEVSSPMLPNLQLSLQWSHNKSGDRTVALCSVRESPVSVRHAVKGGGHVLSPVQLGGFLKAVLIDNQVPCVHPAMPGPS